MYPLLGQWCRWRIKIVLLNRLNLMILTFISPFDLKLSLQYYNQPYVNSLKINEIAQDIFQEWFLIYQASFSTNTASLRAIVRILIALNELVLA